MVRYVDMEFFMLLLAMHLIGCAPAEESKRWLFSVAEEKPIGTYVGQLVVKNSSQFEQYGELGMFHTDNHTGKITTRKVIDREKLNVEERHKGLTFYVLIDKLINVTVKVRILDINDNYPKFDRAVFKLNVADNIKVERLFRLVNAVDLDEGDNATVSYKIVQGDPLKHFQLKMLVINGRSNLHLKLSSALNTKEKAGKIQLKISACDNQLNHCSYLLVNIIFIRANRKTPKFRKELYTAEVFENATIGQIIIQVKAIDHDEGSSGEIEYSMWGVDRFAIQKKSGKVYVRRKLDAEARVSYTLVVIVKDKRETQKKASVHVSVTVLDCNDNPPNVTVQFTSESVYKISEGDEVPKKVARLVVSDIDRDPVNNQVSLILINTLGYLELQKENDEYFIYLSKVVDRESTSEILLHINASDSGIPPLYSELKVPLIVGDVNDNPPLFEKNMYNVSVNESMPIGYTLLQLKALDSDIGINAQILYHISLSSVENWFNIDERSGVISIVNPLDHEQVSSVLLQVTATDQGNPTLNGSTQINIDILDANDNDPYFTSSIAEFNITENNKVPSFIGQVTAVDIDSLETSGLRYSTHSPHFSVDPTTGEIKVHKMLDREEIANYKFEVLATDGGGRYGSIKVVVHVLDVNDNAPMFEHVFYNFSVHENFPVNKVVAYVRAIDLDEGRNSEVIYSCNQTEGIFSVDSHTGAIILKQDLQKLKIASSYFTITIEDGGMLKGINSAEVLINVFPPNTEPLVFKENNYTFVVMENNKIGSKVGAIVASRRTSGSQSLIDYKIQSGNENKVFAISSFGTLKTVQQIDYEAQSFFQLVVVASDELESSLKSNVTVRIEIGDENDNAPTFATINPTISVDEGHPIGYVFHKCKAIDLDSGTNGMVQYKILNSSGPFDIDGSKGYIFTNGTLDYELISLYELHVMAYDLGNPVLKTIIKMTIHVLDVNDNPPLFQNISYLIHVNEDFQVGMEIMRVNAFDRDSGENGMFFFKLDNSQGEAGKFHLSHDGLLTLKEPIDREVKDSYTLKAVVVDRGIPFQTSSTRIRVLIDDVNDEIPKFEHSFYNFELREELPAGTTVGALIIKDADTGKNGEVSCSLLNHNDKFRVDSKYASFHDQSICTLSSAMVFDREKHGGSYNVSVIAKDHGFPSKSNRITVKINIKNVHDHPPKFSQNLPYLACVVEETPRDSLVTQIFATDNDAMPLPLNYSLIAMSPDEKPGLSLFWISLINGSVFTKTIINKTLKPAYQMTVCIKEFGSDNVMYNYQKLIVFTVPKIRRTIFLDHCVQTSVRESQSPSKGVIFHGYRYKSSFQMTDYGIERLNYDVLPFQVLRGTGLIKLTAHLNHRNRPFYQLNVTAAGWRGKLSYKDSIIVNIFVVPKNVYPPSYPNNPEEFVIAENSIPLTTFATLKMANDLDYGMEGHIMYSIAETTPVDAPINISPLSREITFTKPIDREEIEQFVVKVRMTDLALDSSHRLSNTFTVYLSVLDVNDNPPVFKSSDNSFVYEDDIIGTTVINIQAEDPDKGDTNTHILYKIISGNKNDMFQLDGYTGRLVTNKLLNINEYQNYTLVIMAYEYRDAKRNPSIPSLKSTMTISIDVIDVNDNPPKFSSSKVDASVAENMPPGTIVVKLNASDADVSHYNKEFIFDLLDNLDVFNIDARTGLIKTKTVLDREKDSLIMVSVMVKNVAIPLGHDLCTVLITVDDVNDFPPVFPDGGTIELHILENTLPATLHKFAVTDADSGRNAEVEYHLAATKDLESIFELDKLTGSFSLLKILDREECDSYSFSVEAVNVSPPYHKASQHVTIIVDDENDEKPIFSRNLYKVVVREDEEVNTTVAKVTAIDKDVGINANIIYSMLNDEENSSQPFAVNADNGEIFLIKQLDYEKVKQHKLTIKANGFGYQSYNITTVIVNVQDVNDNCPVFDKSIYNLSIQTVQTLLPILKVHATDADEDGRQRIKYFLSPNNREFIINKNTGKILIRNPKLTSGQYRLHVKARDVAYPQRESFGQVLITIGQGNDNVLNFMNSSVVFSLMENPKQNHRLGFVIAKSHSDQPVFYSIVESSNPDFAFGIKKKTGDIYVNNSQAVDYERHPLFFLGVIAYTKFDGKIHNSYLSVLVNLSDVNDNIPEIIPTYSKFSYPETNQKDFPPTYMHLFHVHDADNIDDGKLSIEIIAGNTGDVFAINQWRHLLVVKSMDFETQQVYNLIVRVTDSAIPPHYSDSHIVIEVEDINDNPPVFKGSMAFDVHESTLVGSIIANVTASDDDLTSTDLSYCIESHDSTVNSYFDIDKYLGTITLLHNVDYEKQSMYSINVSAFDGVHRTYASVQINIVDDNDNIPIFTQQVYTVKVWPHLKKDKYVTKVTATDLDQGDNGHVQYQIDPPKDAFTIEQETGIIKTNKDFNFSRDVYSFQLTVIAFDSYGKAGSRRSSSTVNLIISGKKPIVPQFLKKNYVMMISEGASIGTAVGQVIATCPSGLHQKMKYRITDGNHDEAFNIDIYQGLITVNNKIDRESIDHYALSLVANAHGSNESARCTAFIQIQDANDNSPIFETNSYNHLVYENITLGDSLLQMKATDADDPTTDNALIKYEIHSGQDKYDWLVIDPETGWVKTQKKLDREVCATIQLTIKASDHKGSGKTAFASLNVTVLDVNDNTPKFSVEVPSIHELEVDENEPPNTIVFKAEAIDNDEGSNGRVSYRILDGDSEKNFHMTDSEPGWVYTSVSLDYEEHSLYNLTVVAYDHGIPSKEASFEYLIAVKDINEYQPLFRQSSYEFKLLANVKVGEIIGQVLATDKDKGPAGVIRYTFTSFVKEFSIHEKHGHIIVNWDLRRPTYSNRRRRNVRKISEDESEFLLKVRADNGPNSTLFTIVPVSIKVNFSCPTCYKGVTFVKEMQDTMTGSTLMVVLASVAVFVILLFLLCLAVYCRRKHTCYHKRKHPPPRFCPSRKGEISPCSSLDRQLLNSGTSSVDRIPIHFFTDCSKPGTYMSSESGMIQESISATARTTSTNDKASTFSFGIYHEQAIPESEMHRFTDNLSDMSLKDLEHDSVFAYPAINSHKNLMNHCVSRSIKGSSLCSLLSNRPKKDPVSLSSRQKSLPQSFRRGSHESLKDFKEEGGGEAAGGIDVGNLLYAKLAVVDADEQDAVMDGVQAFNEEGLPSRGGSLSTIIGSDVDIRGGNYNCNYIDSWGPQFNASNSIYSGVDRSLDPAQTCALIKQKKEIGNSDTRMISKLNSIAHLVSKKDNKKQNEEITMGLLNSGSSVYTSGTLSPNFSSVMTPLIYRTPSVSSLGCQDTLSRPADSYKNDVYDSSLNISVLQRNGSVGSQLSRITLSDINVSDEEI